MATLKCKLCDYTVYHSYRTKKGKFVTPQSAFSKMEDHYIEKHEPKYDELQSQLDKEFGDPGREENHIGIGINL